MGKGKQGCAIGVCTFCLLGDGCGVGGRKGARPLRGDLDLNWEPLPSSLQVSLSLLA